jgi:hypothetical protein
MFLRFRTLFAACSLLMLSGAPAFALTPAEAAGEYVATVDGGTFETSGRFRLVLSKGGLGSVAVTIGEEPPCVVGIGWGGDGPLLIRGGDADMFVVITIRLIDGSLVAIGDVTDDGHTFPIEAPRVAASGGSAVGLHTFVMGTETGLGNTGNGFARVLANGHVRGVVSTSPSRRRAFAGRVSSTGDFPFVARVGEDNSLVGNLTFGAESTAGELAQHHGDATTAVMVGGAPYNRDLPAITGSPAPAFATIAVDGHVSGGALGLRNNGAFINATLGDAPLRLRVHRKVGLVSGRQGTITARGVVLQPFNGCAGLLSNGSAFAVYGPGSPLAPAPSTPVGE